MCLITIEFAKRLKTIKNFSDKTVEIYIRSLTMFDDYVQDLTF